jgi:hypothetical protein
MKPNKRRSPHLLMRIGLPGDRLSFRRWISPGTDGHAEPELPALRPGADGKRRNSRQLTAT